MTGLAPPHDRWEPETAKAAVLSTLRPAAIPSGVVKLIADSPATRPWYGPEDGCCARSRQELSWWGASALRWESEMDRAGFLKFLAHFQMYRHIDGAGDETIPPGVVVAAFDAWEESRSLGPIADWERVEAFLNEVPGQDVYDDEFLDWARDVVENRGWWRPDNLFEGWRVEKFRTLEAKHRHLNAQREAIRLRRAEAARALSDPELRRRVFERDGHQCRGCSSRERLAVDHIVAVINGGSDDFENLQTLCRTCNSSKGRKQAAAWQRRAKKEGLS